MFPVNQYIEMHIFTMVCGKPAIAQALTQSSFFLLILCNARFLGPLHRYWHMRRRHGHGVHVPQLEDYSLQESLLRSLQADAAAG